MRWSGDHVFLSSDKMKKDLFRCLILFLRLLRNFTDTVSRCASSSLFYNSVRKRENYTKNQKGFFLKYVSL